MSKIPQKARAYWFYTTASIPTGWSRDTDFDDRFMQGSNLAGVNGGSATHTHTADAHNHIQNSHFHVLTITGSSVGTNNITGTKNNIALANVSHSHASASSVSATGTNQPTVVTISSDNTPPPYVTAIIIKPDDASQDLPNDVVVLSNIDAEPTGFHKPDGTVGTIDLFTKFIKGAAAGADGGLAVGVTVFHTHTSTAHTHIQDAHTHDDSNFGAAATTYTVTNDGTNGVPAVHHTATDIQNTTAVTINQTATADSVVRFPACHGLICLQNKSGVTKPVCTSMILPFTGTSAEIPAYWFFCDGTQGTPDLTAVQIYSSIALPGGFDGSGSDTHTHLISAHTHSTSVHTHTYTFTTTSANCAGTTTPSRASLAHLHSSNAMGTRFITNQNNVIRTMSTEDIRYFYRTVLFIMYNPPTVHMMSGNILGSTHIM